MSFPSKLMIITDTESIFRTKLKNSIRNICPEVVLTLTLLKIIFPVVTTQLESNKRHLLSLKAHLLCPINTRRRKL
ncbi:unnamed protein product [Adineta ricciae]|uniref:Uncharacterized protein n=1 Tax=Adineta ricciae TaxID=249248 RepID=A0A815S1I0_ADIRI|nr:unnamed protein product [Adineta ricciae]